jgi:DNA-binding MarR family transcriptional regulator
MEDSSFDLIYQNQHIESKIVVALERISEAFRVLLWNESKENALSPIQNQILIFLLFHTEDKCKVGYLAQEFNMTKATISDSIKVLLQKNLIEKQEDIHDSRSFSIVLTEEGKIIAQKSAAFAKAIEKPLHQFPTEQKEILLLSLLEVIEKLNKQGIITIQRMCLTCRFYQNTHERHYCKFLEKPLKNTDLRVDCTEYETLPL